MVRYRRNRIAGATYFFTVTLRDRKSDLLVREIEALRAAWRAAASRVPHVVIAAVVLPDHLHAVIRMVDGTADFPRLWQDIKKGFTRRVAAPGERSPWQSRYWERTVRDEAELQALVDYVHINPLKHGLVDAVAAWPHSSFHRYVSRGLLCEEGVQRMTAKGRLANSHKPRSPGKRSTPGIALHGDVPIPGCGLRPYPGYIVIAPATPAPARP